MDTGSTNAPEQARSVEIYDANEKSLIAAGFQLISSYNNCSSAFISDGQNNHEFKDALLRAQTDGNEVRFTTSGGVVRLWVKPKAVVSDVAAGVRAAVEKVGG
ncbi:hypothetical protein HZA42_03855 [Candidatus Peregrinibacteria bacterium]|nr:hypothetical protein [Candidatus Peregrinibacteria bacterium]